MSKTHFPRSGGQEFVDSFYRFNHLASGDVFFVHSGGSSTGPGYSPETAYSTIDAAIGACTADNGDVIVVLENHAENVSAAAGIALDVAGVKIVGLGEGRRRPRITFDTDDEAALYVSAARCVVENLVFIADIDALDHMVSVTAADCLIQNCEFEMGDACLAALLGIEGSTAADRLRILNNYMYSATADPITAAIQLVGADHCLIEGNVIVCACGTNGCVSNITTECLQLVIKDNTLLNNSADGNNKLVVVDADTTGPIVGNRGGIIDSTCPAPLTAAKMHLGGNYFSTNDDTASTLDGG